MLVCRRQGAVNAMMSRGWWRVVGSLQVVVLGALLFLGCRADAIMLELSLTELADGADAVIVGTVVSTGATGTPIRISSTPLSQCR